MTGLLKVIAPATRLTVHDVLVRNLVAAWRTFEQAGVERLARHHLQQERLIRPFRYKRRRKGRDRRVPQVQSLGPHARRRPA